MALVVLHFCCTVGNVQQIRKTCLFSRTLFSYWHLCRAGTAMNSFEGDILNLEAKCGWAAGQSWVLLWELFSVGCSAILNCTFSWICSYTAAIEILLFHQSYYCRQQGAVHSLRKPFTMKDILHRGLWCPSQEEGCLFRLFCLINLHCLTWYTQTWAPNVFQKVNERMRPLLVLSALLCTGQLDDKPISLGNPLNAFIM